MDESAEWWVYLVRCADGSLYAGATNDVLARVRAHDEGRGARYTRARRPVALAWCEPVGTRSEARRREWLLKRAPTRVKRLAADGAVAHDVAVDAPRSRARGSRP